MKSHSNKRHSPSLSLSLSLIIPSTKLQFNKQTAFKKFNKYTGTFFPHQQLKHPTAVAVCIRRIKRPLSMSGHACHMQWQSVTSSLVKLKLQIWQLIFFTLFSVNGENNKSIFYSFRSVVRSFILSAGLINSCQQNTYFS